MWSFNKEFNKEFYDAIESFQGKRVVNKPLDVRDVHVEGDGLYIPPPKKHTLDSYSLDFYATSSTRTQLCS
jgi:hypothetical protein